MRKRIEQDDELELMIKSSKGYEDCNPEEALKARIEVAYRNEYMRFIESPAKKKNKK